MAAGTEGSTGRELAVLEGAPPALRAELTIAELVAQATKVHQAMQLVMKEGEHYGTIPGTQKPTLLQPGAQKLLLLFRLDPQPESTAIAPDLGGGGHYSVKSKMTLYHIPTGQRMGSGEGLCSTREVKYAYRLARLKCPHCKAEAIIRGKQEYGGGWLCFKKAGGCGAKFEDDDQVIVTQPQGRVANEELADSYNTVIKIANKRALVAAVLNVTAASDVFTQDLEDEDLPTTPAPKPAAPAARAPAADAAGANNRSVATGESAEAQAHRDSLLDQVMSLSNALKLKADARAALWVKHCGASADPRSVDVAALEDLVADLRKQTAK